MIRGSKTRVRVSLRGRNEQRQGVQSWGTGKCQKSRSRYEVCPHSTLADASCTGRTETREFVEHAEERFVPNILATFARCRYVAMTHALPGQGGHHHVNEQHSGYWIEKLASVGHVYDDATTQEARSICEPATFARRTLLLFEKRTEAK